MHQVKVRIESTDDSVRVTNVGPTKRIPWLYSYYLGIRRGDLFHDHWTTRFSPVHSVFDHWWTSSDESRERMIRWRVFIFFVPQDEKTTRIFSIAYAKSRYPGPAGLLRLVSWLFRRELDKEIRGRVHARSHGQLRRRDRRSETQPLRQGAWPDPGTNQPHLPRCPCGAAGVGVTWRFDPRLAISVSTALHVPSSCL